MERSMGEVHPIRKEILGYGDGLVVKVNAIDLEIYIQYMYKFRCR